ncbi:hypothetical protein JCM3770_006367 [Rhodotorula araucariae]
MTLPSSPLQSRSHTASPAASTPVANRLTRRDPLGPLDSTTHSCARAFEAGAMRISIDAGGRAILSGAGAGGGGVAGLGGVGGGAIATFAPSTPVRGSGGEREWVHEDWAGGREEGVMSERGGAPAPQRENAEVQTEMGTGTGRGRGKDEWEREPEHGRTQEDADAELLRQFSYAFSPSPKRKTPPRAVTKQRRHAATNSLSAETARESWATGAVGAGATEAGVPQAESSPAQLAANPFTTPARSAATTRQVSIGTGLSSLSLEGATRRPALSPTGVLPPVPALVSPPLSPLARNLVRILAHPERLPLGLVALLEACVRESDAAALGQGGIGGLSELAVKTGHVSPPVPAPLPVAVPSCSSDDALMPPPSLPLQRARSISSSSLPLQHSRTTSSSSAVSQYSSSSLSRARALSVPPDPTDWPLYASTVDDLPSIPLKAHPCYPRGTTLRFVYETGLGSYEEQRECRTAHLSQSAAREASGPSRPSKRRARRMRKVEEEEGSGQEEGSVDEADSPGEEAFTPAKTKAKLRGRAATRAASVAGKRQRAETAALLEGLAGADGSEVWGVRRSKRVRKSVR